jgi:hypothetical protein
VVGWGGVGWGGVGWGGVGAKCCASGHERVQLSPVEGGFGASMAVGVGGHGQLKGNEGAREGWSPLLALPLINLQKALPLKNPSLAAWDESAEVEGSAELDGSAELHGRARS